MWYAHVFALVLWSQGVEAPPTWRFVLGSVGWVTVLRKYKFTSALAVPQCGEGFAPVTLSSEAWCLSQILSPHRQELCVGWFLADHIPWNGNTLRHICPQSVPSLEKNGPTLGFVICVTPAVYQTIRMIPNVCPRPMFVPSYIMVRNTWHFRNLYKEETWKWMPSLPHTGFTGNTEKWLF